MEPCQKLHRYVKREVKPGETVRMGHWERRDCSEVEDSVTGRTGCRREDLKCEEETDGCRDVK